MKSIILFTLLLVAVLPSCGGRSMAVKFYDGTWDQTLQQAHNTGKFIYVDAYTDWCGWCKRMDSDTFSDTTVGAYMNEHFVSVQLNMEKGEGLQLAKKYSVREYPTSLIFNSSGRLVYRTAGYMPPGNFLAMLRAAQNAGT